MCSPSDRRAYIANRLRSHVFWRSVEVARDSYTRNLFPVDAMLDELSPEPPMALPRPEVDEDCRAALLYGVLGPRP